MNKKEAMPHIRLKDGTAADLYFEFLDSEDRKEVFDDLLKGNKVKLPDFGKVKNESISNIVKELTKEKVENLDLIKNMMKGKSYPILDYDDRKHKYKVKANLDFIDKVYNFKDIPKKRKYILDRLKEIYEIDDSILNDILDKVKIFFRKQDEKGASNHVRKEIYISLNEIKKYGLKTLQDFLKYLEHPKSIITHETTHIFQNILKAFPDIKYLEKKDNGWEINYEKYVSDPGEVQSRIEQILEMLKWGFSKEEIIQFLFNRKEMDQDLWKILVDSTIKMKDKFASSRLPGIDDNEDVSNEQGRYKNDYHKKNRGKNYEKDYISGGPSRKELEKSYNFYTF